MLLAVAVVTALVRGGGAAAAVCLAAVPVTWQFAVCVLLLVVTRCLVFVVCCYLWSCVCVLFVMCCCKGDKKTGRPEGRRLHRRARGPGAPRSVAPLLPASILLFVCCVLFVACCLLLGVCCLWFVVAVCLLFVVCYCVLSVVCCFFEASL